MQDLNIYTNNVLISAGAEITVIYTVFGKDFIYTRNSRRDITLPCGTPVEQSSGCTVFADLMMNPIERFCEMNLQKTDVNRNRAGVFDQT